MGNGLKSGGGGPKNSFCSLSSYFASRIYDPRTLPSGRNDCVGGGGVEGKFSFGPKLGFRFCIQTWTKLNNKFKWPIYKCMHGNIGLVY